PSRASRCTTQHVRLPKWDFVFQSSRVSVIVSEYESFSRAPASTIGISGGLIFALSSTVEHCTIGIDNVELHADNYGSCFVYADSQSSLLGVNLSVSDSLINGSQSRLIYFSAISLQTVSILIKNVTCNTQLPAVLMGALLPQTTAVTLSITHSWIAAAVAVALVYFDAASLALVINTSTLRIVGSSSVVAALYCSTVSLTNSNIRVDAVRMISDALATKQMVFLTSFFLTNTTVAITITSLDGLCGIVGILNSAVDQSSTIRVQVKESMTVDPNAYRIYCGHR
ncbi:transmembrane protein, putative, partial [Bodo saltans]